MRVTVIYEQDLNEDGVDCLVTYSQGGVECLRDLAWVFAEAARAGGYTYVDTVKVTTEHGHEFESPY